MQWNRMDIVDGEVFPVGLELGAASFDHLIFFSGHPILVERVLEVETGQLCYIVGTVYMDMPMKPNILEDIARDVGDSLLDRSFLC